MPRQKRTERGYFERTVDLGLDPATGKRVRKRVRAKTLSNLQEKVRELETDRARGMPAQGRKPTLEVFLTRWLEEVVSNHNRPRTYERYEMDVRNHLVPRLGKIRIDKLTTYDIQRFVNDLATSGRMKAGEDEPKGLSPRSVRNAYATLRKALNTAISWKLVRENVALGVELPKARKPRIRALTAAQARALLDTVRGERFEALYWMALMLGLRQGELLALRWADLDFDSGTLQVQGAVQRQKRKEGKSKLVFVDTKTEQGQRQLPLLPPLPAILRMHRAQQDVERSVEGWHEHDLVFPNEIGRPVEAQNLVNRSFKPALKRAKLPTINFHALRHTTVSLLIASGFDPNTASYIAGHASAAFTVGTYGHAMPEAVKAGIARMGELLQSDRILELPPRREAVEQPADAER
jgi:integrase